MDPLALAAGNLLLGNDEDAAGDRGAGLSVPGALCRRLRVRAHRRRLHGPARRRAAAALVDAAKRKRRARCCTWACRARTGAGAPAAPTCAWPAASTCPRCWARAARSCAAPSAAWKGARCAAATRLRAGAHRAPARASPASACVPPALDLPLQADGLTAVRVLPAAEYGDYTERFACRFLVGKPGRSRRKATATATGWPAPPLEPVAPDRDALARHRAGRHPGPARRPAHRPDVRRPAFGRLSRRSAP